MAMNDKIKAVHVDVYPKAIVTVRIPDLTPEEYERRLNNLKAACANLILDSKRRGLID